MSKYFRVYVRTKSYKMKNAKVKTPEEVLQMLRIAKKKGCVSYLVQKYIKPNVEAIIAQGELQIDKALDIPALYVDWRLIEGRVIDWSKYPKCMEKYKDNREGR